jgi:hypothetical protein
MTTGRTDHSATLLPNGKILILGGDSPAGYQKSADLYDVGQGISEGRRPVIVSLSTSGTALNITGSNFRGDSEGSNGKPSSSASNYPLLRLQRLDNDHTFFLPPDAATSWSASSFISRSQDGLPSGYYLASIITNAIPSMATMVSLAPSPNIDLSSSALDFGGVGINNSVTLQVTIMNTGSGDLNLGTLVFSGDVAFSQGAGGTCGSSVAPGGSCMVAVRFQPTSSGSKIGTLAIPSNDTGSPSINVTLSGYVPTYLLTVNYLGSGGGTVVITPKPQAIDCIGTCSQSFDAGSVVTLSPIADGSSVFSGWNNCQSIAGSVCTITLGTVYSVDVYFNSNIAGNVKVGSSFYSTVTNGLGSVASGGEISLKTGSLFEVLNFNRPLPVKLKGGYNDLFSAISGMTTIFGSLTITSGTLTVDTITIQ